MRTIKLGGAYQMLVLAGWATAAGAVNTAWVGGDGAWTNETLWSEGAVPAASDRVYVTNAGPDDMTVTYENPSDPKLLYLGLERSGGGMLVVTQRQDYLSVTGNVHVGQVAGSRVTFVQAAGTNLFGISWPFTFSLGHTAGATATYHLVSGALAASGNIGGLAANAQIGSGGCGTFIQEGGLFQGQTTFTTVGHSNKELVLGGVRGVEGGSRWLYYNYGRTVGGDGTYLLKGGTVCFRNVFVGHIDSGKGTFVQTGGTNRCDAFNIGFYGVGVFEFKGGKFVGGSTFRVGDYGGTGTWTQAGGYIGGANVYSRLFVGYDTTNSAGVKGLGRVNIYGGTNIPYYSECQVGVTGRGILSQTNGVFKQTDNSGIDKYTVSFGYTNSASGTFHLSGGEFWAKTLAVGNAISATGEVSHTGGTLAIGGAIFGGLVIGRSDSAVGTYSFGDASGTGLITNTTDTTGNDLTVRLTAGASGTFRGWGEVHLNDTLINNGRIVADGYGTDRALSLERFVRVSNTVENAAGEANGWYAQSGGKLTLPGITVAAGDGSYTWGESAGDAEIDLVNSLRFTFTGVAGGGVLTNSLLAADRADLPPLPEGFKAVGVWQVRKPAGLGYGTLGLTFRYDAARVAALGLKDVTLLQTTGGAWLSVPGSMNSAASLYSAAAVVLGTDTYFALGRGPYGTLIRVQ